MAESILDITTDLLPLNNSAMFTWTLKKGSQCSAVQNITLVNDGIKAEMTSFDGKPATTDGTAINTCKSSINIVANDVKHIYGEASEGIWECISWPATGVESSDIKFADPTNFSTSVSGLTAIGSYEFKWSVKKGDCSDEITQLVSVQSFSIDADGTQDSRTVAVCGDKHNPVGEVSLSESEIGSIEWSVLSGTATITPSTGTLKPEISGITATGARIQLKVTSVGGCENTDFFDIQNGKPTLTVSKLTDGVICDGKVLVNGTGSNPDEGKLGQWIEVNPDPSKSGYFADADGNEIAEADATTSNIYFRFNTIF